MLHFWNLKTESGNTLFHFTVLFKTAQSQQKEEGAKQLGQLSHTVKTLQPRGALFLISESGRGRGTAISFATRLHGICNESHNKMEDGAHMGHLSYRPAPQLWTGDKCPPLFPRFVWKGIALLYQP